ncbi:hypothetical protein F0562_020001 [Nyssa sinensis]|uniref:Uncharacterized protein n=1 Tax=Nyssa sinensis TaxID=561372 RepID=A0A5J5BTZ6_9ASTE|nr:hypothetical protein F0562_020001 [Nyssa sinensis]
MDQKSVLGLTRVSRAHKHNQTGSGPDLNCPDLAPKPNTSILISLGQKPYASVLIHSFARRAAVDTSFQVVVLMLHAAS